MRYGVWTEGSCPEPVCESDSLREVVRCIEYCFDDAEHGIVLLAVYKLKWDGSPNARVNPAHVSYDHGDWIIGGTGTIPDMLRSVVNHL